MKKLNKLSRIITSALLLATFTACGEVSEVSDSGINSETKTTESVTTTSEIQTETLKESSVSETEATEITTDETSVESSASETDAPEITTEASVESSASETNTPEITTKPEIEIPENNTEATAETESVTPAESYQTAYIEMATELDDGKCKFNLIYFDNDDIPELVVGADGYYISLYTYSNGEIYTLMDHWGYGAMGNSGYEYVPEKNSLRNYNSDYAGAIRYTTYMAISENHSMDTTTQIETFNFDDVNGNGMPDEDESESIGNYSKSYIDGKEISDEDIESYNVGEYEFISVSMTLDELKSALMNQ